MSDILHDAVHTVLGESPNPVVGALGGAAAGTAVGTVAVVKLATLGTVVGAVKVAGIVAVAHVAAPVVVPFTVGCAVFGFACGLKNWLQKP